MKEQPKLVPEYDSNNDDVESVASDASDLIIEEHNYAAIGENSAENDNNSIADTLENGDADNELEEEAEPQLENNDIRLSVYLGAALRRHIHANQLSDIEFNENGPTQIIVTTEFQDPMQVPAEGVVYVISDPDSFDDMFPDATDSDSGFGRRTEPSPLATSDSEAYDSDRSERFEDNVHRMLHRTGLVRRNGSEHGY